MVVLLKRSSYIFLAQQVIESEITFTKNVSKIRQQMLFCACTHAFLEKPAYSPVQQAITLATLYRSSSYTTAFLYTMQAWHISKGLLHVCMFVLDGQKDTHYTTHLHTYIHLYKY